ncbi:tetraspanin-5-like [Saccoglossus kowalevskii]|uniref:Tetraspanin n=1 Tax=Saccoglossus kowalevskii TaxID=10224 RepID=A0ABM0MJ23_SACKO|nr:PREDICTED: tetraspanin-5-like [Saccoglossus kowalevskii]
MASAHMFNLDSLSVSFGQKIGTFSNITSITNFVLDPAFIFIVVGGIIFVLGFCGCIGALRENVLLLRVYSVVLGIIFFAELAIGILGFVYKDWVKSQIEDGITNIIVNYREDPDLQDVIDGIQQSLKCCGGKDYHDWENNIYFNCSLESRGAKEACGVPYSCCIESETDAVVNTMCGYDVRKEDYPLPAADVIFTKGCVPAFSEWIETNLVIVGAIVIGIALLQICGICFAQNLVNDIEEQKAKWRYR